jgi:hypothetical protein
VAGSNSLHSVEPVLAFDGQRLARWSPFDWDYNTGFLTNDYGAWAWVSVGNGSLAKDWERWMKPCAEVQDALNSTQDCCELLGVEEDWCAQGYFEALIVTPEGLYCPHNTITTGKLTRPHACGVGQDPRNIKALARVQAALDSGRTAGEALSCIHGSPPSEVLDVAHIFPGFADG